MTEISRSLEETIRNLPKNLSTFFTANDISDAGYGDLSPIAQTYLARACAAAASLIVGLRLTPQLGHQSLDHIEEAMVNADDDYALMELNEVLPNAEYVVRQTRLEVLAQLTRSAQNRPKPEPPANA